ncbi:MAG: alkaline phosphatase family protein, partial [Clostridia bacterium]|nr:alkaline phosphatase family protein [Clostridia bacterium]
MKMTTRWLALLLATLLCITAFAACAPDTPDTPPTEEPPDDNPPSEPSDENDNKESEEPEKMDRYLYKRVVLIGVDGAGAFFRDTDTPCIDEIFENGAISYNVLTSNPTISAQCWGSMLHGVTPGAHRLTNAIVGERAYPTDSPYPSVFRVIRENNPDAKLASFTNWNPINIGIIEDGLGVHKDSATDAPMTEKICDYVKKNDPTLLFVQFDEVDHAGHTAGYNTKAHLDQITATDELIGKIYDAYDEMDYLEDTLFIVTADHGGTGLSHGGLSDAEKYVMLAATGKTVENGEIIDMEIRDCASVILYALGYEQPDSWTGRVPSGLFEGVEAGERPVSSEGNGGHINVDTPKRGSGNYITDVLGKDRILAYLPMDGDAMDEVGDFYTEENGKLYFVEGYFGEGV